ncbi:MAG: DUF2752 domain-containing protein [Thermotogae bacterium]|nr:DUF2752 domain-containing protein [Thermotogota bacterium]
MGIPYSCPYRSITGIPDGGCGTYRSLMALLKGDIAGSLYLNPLTLPTLLLLGLMPFLPLRRRLLLLKGIILAYALLTIVRLLLHLAGLRVPFIYPPEL